jgi:hypothetical protein
MTAYTLIFFVDPSFRRAAGRVASLNVSMRRSFAKYTTHSTAIAPVCTASKASGFFTFYAFYCALSSHFQADFFALANFILSPVTFYQIYSNG